MMLVVGEGLFSGNKCISRRLYPGMLVFIRGGIISLIYLVNINLLD